MKICLTLVCIVCFIVFGIPSSLYSQEPVVRCVCMFDTEDKTCGDLWGIRVAPPLGAVNAFIATCFSEPCFEGSCGEQPQAPLEIDYIPEKWDLPRASYRFSESGGEDLTPDDPIFCAGQFCCAGCEFLPARPSLPAGNYCSFEVIGQKPFPQYKECPGINGCADSSGS